MTVEPYDKAFYEPTKVIGRYMSKEDAETGIKRELREGISGQGIPPGGDGSEAY